MTLRFTFSGLAALLLLAACAGGAVSRTPVVSREELAAEQREQAAIVKAEQARKSSAASTTKSDRKQMLERLSALRTRILPAGTQICRQLRGAQATCEFPFALDKDTATEINAYTDGKQLVISPAMMHFADDDELAVVLAHEYAHAIMTHPGKAQQNATVGGLLGMAADVLARTQGFDTGGTFGNLGAQTAILRYSQGFEREADYIGLYILGRAGYPVTEAKKFWRRMATVNPQGIYNSSTHPTTAERYLLLDKTAAEIKQKRAAGAPVLPEKLPKE